MAEEIIEENNAPETVVEGDTIVVDTSVPPETESSSDGVSAAVTEAAIDQAKDIGALSVVVSGLVGAVEGLTSQLEGLGTSVVSLNDGLTALYERVSVLESAEVSEAVTIETAVKEAEETGESVPEAVAEATEEAATETASTITRGRNWL